MGLRDYYRRQMFFPGLTGLLLNPFYLARKGLVDHLTNLSRFVRGRTLDIGCGTKPYEKCFNASQYVGLEINSASKQSLFHTDVRYDGYAIPFRDNVFDSVLAFQVLEHVFEPDIFFGEIRRVLKPDGILLLTVPFIWEEHEKPNDFARYSSFGLDYLLNKQRFHVLQTEKTMAGFRTALQVINICLYKRFSKNKRPFRNLFVAFFLTGPINIIGTLFGKSVSTNGDLYLDNLVLASPRKNIQQEW